MDLMGQSAIPDRGCSQHYDILHELGACFAALGQMEQAQECYERAESLAADETKPYPDGGIAAGTDIFVFVSKE